MRATKPRKRTRDREILLVLNEKQYRKAGLDLQKLKAAGAPSNTAAILEALSLASSMTPNPTEEGSPS